VKDIYTYIYTQKKGKNIAKKSLSLKQELYNDTGCTGVPSIAGLLLYNNELKDYGGSGCDVIWSGLYLLGRTEKKQKKLLSGQMMSGSRL
jgi:hypothetical protein